MAEKVKKLDIQRDYKQFLYFIDGSGNVAAKPKSGLGAATVIVAGAIVREQGWLYFIDKDGDISRSAQGVRRGRGKG